MKNTKSYFINVVLIIITAIIISMFFPKRGSFKYEYSIGGQWQHEDLVAAFDFPIMKTEKEINDDINKIKANKKLYFNVKKETIKVSQDLYISYLDKELTSLSDNNNKILKNILENESAKNDFLTKMRFWGLNILDSIYAKGIIQENTNIVGRSDEYIIYTSDNNVSFKESFLGTFYTVEEAIIFIEKNCKRLNELETQLTQTALLKSIKPNVFLNEETTNIYQTEEINNVSKTKGAIGAGEKIISKNEIIDSEKNIILESYKQKYNKENESVIDKFSLKFGQFLFVFILLTFLYFFLFLFRPSIFFSPKDFLSIVLLKIVLVAIIFIISFFPNLSLYSIPFAILPIVIRSFYDTRTALFSHIIFVIIIAYLAPNNYEFLILQITAGMTAIFSFVGFRKRSQIFITGILILFTYVIIYSAFSLMRNGNFSDLRLDHILNFVVSCTLTILAFIFIYFYEKIFGLYSDFTLLELNDTNNKILKELSEKAPGTFQHSIQVANICESIINIIGGNALLARTGALYHDIGKLVEPQFFTENQIRDINPHDSLSDEESAQKIINHILYGKELANKHRLPKVIVDFIVTHHGTQMVRHFYKHFILTHPNEPIDDKKFQYPGPKPQTKEQAVLMIVDSIEAASRSINQPSNEKIFELIENIVQYQLDHKQFDDANISIHEINMTKEILKQKLAAIYHLRVSYLE